MKKLPVLTCKNNHVLASRVTTVLIASLILASTFIITSPLFAQSASFTSNRLPKFTEVDPTLIGCTEQSTQINTHAVKSMLFLKSKKVPFTTITNLSGSDCKAQWNRAADVAKKGCDFLTYYPPTDPSYHLMSDPTLPFWYQFNSFGGVKISLSNYYRFRNFSAQPWYTIFNR